MKRILYALSMLFLLVGCTGVEKGAVNARLNDVVRVERGAVSGTVQDGAVKVTTTAEKDAFFHITEPVIKTEPGTVVVKTSPKTVCIERGAMQWIIESGAFVIQPNAITINLIMGQKPPPIEKPDVKGIRPLTDATIVKKVTDAQLAEDIINNETIYKALIDTLLKRIDIYNKNYAAKEEAK